MKFKCPAPGITESDSRSHGRPSRPGIVQYLLWPPTPGQCPAGGCVGLGPARCPSVRARTRGALAMGPSGRRRRGLAAGHLKAPGTCTVKAPGAGGPGGFKFMACRGGGHRNLNPPRRLGQVFKLVRVLPLIGHRHVQWRPPHWQFRAHAHRGPPGPEQLRLELGSTQWHQLAGTRQ